MDNKTRISQALPPYEQVPSAAGLLSTGDILLCSGNGGWSRRIKKYQEIALKLGLIRTGDVGRDWGWMLDMSHVAAISGGGLVAEATTMNEWAIGPDGKPKRGYQVNPFGRWLENYDGAVWVRKLNIPEGWAFDTRAEMAMQDEAVLGTPYENGIPGGLELFWCGMDIFREAAILRLQTTQIHCTEGRGNIMQIVGILSKKVRTNKLPPCMWGVGGRVDQNLINGFTLGEMQRLK